MAFSIRDVLVQLHGFGTLSAAGAVDGTIPGHEKEVAAVDPLGCEDAS